MSIHYSGTISRSGGLISAIAKQLRAINLKGVKRVTISFDPFNENVKSTREFLVHITSPKIIKTNPDCLVKTNVFCNRKPSEIKISLIDSVKEKSEVKEFRFLSGNLTTLELLQLVNKHISVLAPVEEIVASPLQTKSAKQAVKKATKKK